MTFGDHVDAEGRAAAVVRSVVRRTPCVRHGALVVYVFYVVGVQGSRSVARFVRGNACPHERPLRIRRGFSQTNVATCLRVTRHRQCEENVHPRALFGNDLHLVTSHVCCVRGICSTVSVTVVIKGIGGSLFVYLATDFDSRDADVFIITIQYVNAVIDTEIVRHGKPRRIGAEDGFTRQLIARMIADAA